MRKTSNYKRYERGGAVLAETSPEATVSIDTNASVKDIADDASVAFQRQIDALRQSEAIQRERKAATQSRAETIAQWRQNGLSESQAAFLTANPAMVDTPHLLEAATKVAHLAGHEIDSPEYFQAIKDYHYRHLGPPDESQDIEAPKTKILDLPEAPRSSNSASMFSAPVSRSVPGGSYSDTERNSGRSSRVTLSVAEKEVARMSGISEVDYARGKLEMEQRKADGFYDQ